MMPLLVIEIGLRAVGYNPFGELANGRELILRPSSVKERIYEATPLSGGYAWGTDVRINSHGFRDKDYQLQKPAGTSRVAIIGDSVAFGNSLRPDESFVRRFDELARQRGRAVEVLNLALGGYDTLQEVATLEDIGLQFAPDVVVVGYVVNDVEVASTNVQYILRARKYGSPIYRIRLLQFVRSRLDTALLGQDNELANLETNFAVDNRDYIADTAGDEELAGIMGRLKAEMETHGSAASRFNVANYLSHARIGKLRYALDKLRGLQRQHGFRVLVVIIPYLVEEKRYDSTYRLIYDIVEHESTRAGFEVIRVEGPFEAAGHDQLIIAGWDRIHPNAMGHTLIAEALYKHLYE
jgi:lysophospholipase L1-like esterase